MKNILIFTSESLYCLFQSCSLHFFHLHYSFHPTLAMVTTSSGQRSYKSSIIDTDSDSDHSDIEQPKSRADNSVRLWWIGP